MKLYFVPGACSLAPHIALYEIGAKFEIEKLNPQNKVVSEGNYLEMINPKGSVPALKLDNGEVLTEVSVILQYLADQKPELQLAPKFGTLERYRLMEMLNYIATEIHKGYSQLWNPNAPKEIHEAVMANLSRRFDYLTSILSKQNYLVGNQYSVADIYLFNVLRWTARLKVDMSKWPALLAFCEKIQARPAVQSAIKAEA